MKTKLLINAFGFIFLIFSNLSATAAECENLVPESKDWHFARIILNDKISNDEKDFELYKACRKFNLKSDQAVSYNNYNSNIFVKGLFTVFTDISDVFRNLGGNALENKFMSELIEIKKKPYAIDRVKATYLLVTKYQKPYDEQYVEDIKDKKSTKRTELILTPQQTLREPAVCRDYARLLKWSLQQVGRSNSSRIDAETFTAEIQIGIFKDTGHAWVSVNLPIKDKNGQVTDFARVDLDSTNNSSFIPFMPYAQHLSDDQMNKHYATCDKISKCLDQLIKRDSKLKNENTDASASKTTNSAQ